MPPELRLRARRLCFSQRISKREHSRSFLGTALIAAYVRGEYPILHELLKTGPPLGWWRRGESNCAVLLKTRKLLKIRGAQHARNAGKAVRMYTACTRSSEGRVASFLCGILGLVAFKSPSCSYLRRDERVRKNSTGAAIRCPVRLATACVKCFVLCVSNQSGLLDMAERSTGTSAACLIR